MVYSRPMPSLRTTSLEPAQGVLQAPASRVVQSHALMAPERASYKWCTVYRPQRQTAGTICRKLLLSRCGCRGRRCFPTCQGSQGDCKDRLAHGKAELVLHKN